MEDKNKEKQKPEPKKKGLGQLTYPDRVNSTDSNSDKKMMITQIKTMSNYLNEQQRKFEDYSEKYRKETNIIFRELNRQLILFATAVLSISLFIFGDNFSLKKFLTLINIYWLLSGYCLVYQYYQVLFNFL